MRRQSPITALTFSGVVALAGCVSSEPVILGSNADDGGMQPSDATGEISTLGTSDSGTQVAEAADAASAVCLGNPMFIGTPTDGGGIPFGRRSTLLPDWQVCGGHPDINPGDCSVAAPIGSMTYLGFEVFLGFQGGPAETGVSTALSATVPAGSYPFSIELGVAVSTLRGSRFTMPGNAPAELRIYGSTTPCGHDEELARLGPITNTDSWAQYSGTLIAQQPFSNLVLVPKTIAAPGGGPPQRVGAYVIVGNFVSQTCR